MRKSYCPVLAIKSKRSLCKYASACMLLRVRPYVCVCLCVCMRAWVFVCVHAPMCACMCASFRCLLSRLSSFESDACCLRCGHRLRRYTGHKLHRLTAQQFDRSARQVETDRLDRCGQLLQCGSAISFSIRHFFHLVRHGRNTSRK